jgi:hypothetical protein
LILRLQEEASQEEEHNGWCVKQTKLAEEKRDRKVFVKNCLTKLAEEKRDEIVLGFCKESKKMVFLVFLGSSDTMVFYMIKR